MRRFDHEARQACDATSDADKVCARLLSAPARHSSTCSSKAARRQRRLQHTSTHAIGHTALQSRGSDSVPAPALVDPCSTAHVHSSPSAEAGVAQDEFHHVGPHPQLLSRPLPSHTTVFPLCSRPLPSPHARTPLRACRSACTRCTPCPPPICCLESPAVASCLISSRCCAACTRTRLLFQ